MYLSKNKKSGGTWYIYYRKENGHKTRISTKSKSKKDAYKFLQDFESKIEKSNQVKPITMNEFMYKYLETISIQFTTRSFTLSKGIIEKFAKNTGDVLLKKIDKAMVENYLLNIYQKAKYSAALQSRVLRAFFNKAIYYGYIDSNPVKIKLQVPQNNPIFISIDELNQIIEKEKDSTLAEIYRFAFYTGMRLSEILNLQWNQIDFTNNQIRVLNTATFTTKSKKERVIPIHPIVKEIFNKLRTGKVISIEGLVFSNEGEKFRWPFVSKRFKKAVRKAKLNDSIHFHSLRHSFASNLVQKNISLLIVKELLGHRDIKTTEIYSHLTSNNLREAVNVL